MAPLSYDEDLRRSRQRHVYLMLLRFVRHVLLEKLERGGSPRAAQMRREGGNYADLLPSAEEMLQVAELFVLLRRERSVRSEELRLRREY